MHLLPADLARGAQVYARALCDALRNQGGDHLIVTLYRSKPGPLRPDVELDIVPGIARRLGFDLRAALVLRRALRRLHPTILVAHGSEPFKYAALVRPPGVRLVYYRIGVAAAVLGRSRARRRLWRSVARRAHMVAAVSIEVGAEAQTLLRVPSSRLRVIPNGRDAIAYEATASLAARRSAGAERLRVVFVGHLTATKRPEWFLSAVETLRAKGLDFDAQIVGDGPLLDTLDPAAAVAGVELLGRRNDVAAILSTSDLLLFTSQAEGEGMPGVLIEAGFAGLAAVATDVPGASTVVIDGVTGFVVGLDDLDGLVERAYQLLTDETLRQSMGAAARARCLEHFAIAASARRWQHLFSELTSQK